MKHLTTLMLGLVMVSLLSMSALASVTAVTESCSSTNNLLVGETETYSITEQTVSTSNKYDVTLNYMGLNSAGVREAKFIVNGETTPKLKEGESYNLVYGTVLTVTDMLYQAYAGGVHATSFCLNGEKGTKVVPEVVADEVIRTEPITLNVDLMNYPKLFFNDGKFNAYFVVGARATAMDNLAMTDIATGLEKAGYKIVNAAKLDSEISDPLNTNLIVIGKPGENTVANLLFREVSNSPNPGEGLIKLFKHDGYVQMLVTGYSTEDTRKAAKVLQNYKNYNLQRTSLLVTGTMDKPEVNVLPVVSDSVSTNPQLSGCTKEALVCSDGSTVGRDPNNNCQFKPCSAATIPTPRGDASESAGPMPTKPVETPATEVCGGCKPNGNCLPYGTRLLKEDNPVYCSIDGTFQEQQSLGASCQNNYECSSNQCSNAKCIDLSGQIEETRGFLEKILEWLKKVWG